MIFQAAHCDTMAGHLGLTTTLNRLMAQFFGRAFTTTCTGGYSTSLPKSAVAPTSDNAGPLRTNCYGPHRTIRAISERTSYCLVDYATRYPEAVRMHCFAYSPPWGFRRKYSRIWARHSCHVRYANCMSYWVLNRFAPASFTNKRTGWWNDLIAQKLGPRVGTPLIRCTRGPTSLHRVFPL